MFHFIFSTSDNRSRGDSRLSRDQLLSGEKIFVLFMSLASFEGHYTTGRADLNVIGWPNEQGERIDYDVSIPGSRWSVPV
jgi:hypothetical protein